MKLYKLYKFNIFPRSSRTRKRASIIHATKLRFFAKCGELPVALSLLDANYGVSGIPFTEVGLNSRLSS